MSVQAEYTSPDSTAIFQELDDYEWNRDSEFQGGLRAILGSVQDPQQVEHLTLRAKCYYYARKAGTPVDFDGYKQWVEARRNGHTPSLSNGTSGEVATEPQAEAPKPASFAEICDMIAEGKPIPGIKDIPDTILEGQASESQQSRRKKPWEKDGSGDDKPSWMP